jgi:multidrug efflux pump subunit AcrA (membrane-fusion protein)
MKRGFKRLFVIIGILIVMGGLGSVAYYRYEEKLQLAGGMPQFGRGPEQDVDTVTSVAVYRAKRGIITESLVLNGEVVPLTQVNIFSTVPGKIKEIPVGEGDRVKKDQRLITIDRSEAGMSYSPTPIESTIDGLVKEVYVEIGDYISPQIPLLQVIDMDVVEVVVHIPERDIGRISAGLQAEIEVVSYPDSVFRGKVDELSPVVEPISRTRRACIRINNASHVLKPGMFGKVKIIIRKSGDAILIPVAALVERENSRVVFTVNNEKATLVEPEIDIKEGDMVSVLSGIEEGNSVIVIGQQNVNDGDEVRVTEETQ